MGIAVGLLGISILIFASFKLKLYYLNQTHQDAVRAYQSSYQDQRSKRLELSKIVNENNKSEKSNKDDVKKLTEDSEMLKGHSNEIDLLISRNAGVKGAIGTTTGYGESMVTGEKFTEEQMKKRETEWDKRLTLLQKRIQRESHRELIEMFGKLDMHVEFTLARPKASKFQGDYKFTMKMAPMNVMPHSVHLFLFQVLHNLWDGCSVVVNAPHILQLGPYSSDAKSLAGEFSKKNLDNVVFQEYSESFPHAQWTVGFAGRPAGPDIYINKIDNSFNHGPGGQKHHDLEEEADPCFAQVVGGKDVLEDIFSMKTKNQQNILVEFVTITKARILFPEDSPHEYDETHYMEDYNEDNMYSLDDYYNNEYNDDYHSEHVEEALKHENDKTNTGKEPNTDQKHGTQHLSEIIDS